MKPNFVVMARLEEPVDFGFAVALSRHVVALPFSSEGGYAMSFSILHHWKKPTTRCSICGWSVTLELSKADERGQAVHELCYVAKTLSKFRKPIDEAPQNWAIPPDDALRTAPRPALAGMHWRIFGLIRL